MSALLTRRIQGRRMPGTGGLVGRPARAGGIRTTCARLVVIAIASSVAVFSMGSPALAAAPSITLGVPANGKVSVAIIQQTTQRCMSPATVSLVAEISSGTAWYPLPYTDVSPTDVVVTSSSGQRNLTIGGTLSLPTWLRPGHAYPIRFTATCEAGSERTYFFVHERVFLSIPGGSPGSNDPTPTPDTPGVLVDADPLRPGYWLVTTPSPLYAPGRPCVPFEVVVSIGGPRTYFATYVDTGATDGLGSTGLTVTVNGEFAQPLNMSPGNYVISVRVFCTNGGIRHLIGEGVNAFAVTGQEQPRWLVTVGDSYAAGLGAGSYEGVKPPLPTNHPWYCRRSANSPTEVAGELLAGEGWKVKNFACGGAKSEDLISFQSQHGNPAQLQSLLDFAMANRVEVVNVQINGNDTGWTEALGNCAVAAMLDAYLFDTPTEIDRVAAVARRSGWGEFARAEPTCAERTMNVSQMTRGVQGNARAVIAAINAGMVGLRDSRGVPLYPPGSFRILVNSYPSPMAPRSMPATVGGQTETSRVWPLLYDARYRLGCPVHASTAMALFTGANVLGAQLEAATTGTQNVEFVDNRNALNGFRVCENPTIVDDMVNPLRFGRLDPSDFFGMAAVAVPIPSGLPTEVSEGPEIADCFDDAISLLELNPLSILLGETCAEKVVKRLRALAALNDDFMLNPLGFGSQQPVDSLMANMALSAAFMHEYSGVSMHPNAAGTRVIGACLAEAVRNPAPKHGCTAPRTSAGSPTFEVIDDNIDVTSEPATIRARYVAIATRPVFSDASDAKGIEDQGQTVHFTSTLNFPTGALAVVPAPSGSPNGAPSPLVPAIRQPLPDEPGYAQLLRTECSTTVIRRLAPVGCEHNGEWALSQDSYWERRFTLPDGRLVIATIKLVYRAPIAAYTVPLVQNGYYGQGVTPDWSQLAAAPVPGSNPTVMSPPLTTGVTRRGLTIEGHHWDGNTMCHRTEASPFGIWGTTTRTQFWQFNGSLYNDGRSLLDCDGNLSNLRSVQAAKLTWYYRAMTSAGPTFLVVNSGPIMPPINGMPAGQYGPVRQASFMDSASIVDTTTMQLDLNTGAAPMPAPGSPPSASWAAQTANGFLLKSIVCVGRDATGREIQRVTVDIADWSNHSPSHQAPTQCSMKSPLSSFAVLQWYGLGVSPTSSTNTSGWTDVAITGLIDNRPPTVHMVTLDVESASFTGDSIDVTARADQGYVPNAWDWTCVVTYTDGSTMAGLMSGNSSSERCDAMKGRPGVFPASFTISATFTERFVPDGAIHTGTATQTFGSRVSPGATVHPVVVEGRGDQSGAFGIAYTADGFVVPSSSWEWSCEVEVDDYGIVVASSTINGGVTSVPPDPKRLPLGLTVAITIDPKTSEMRCDLAGSTTRVAAIDLHASFTVMVGTVTHSGSGSVRAFNW